MTETTAPQPEIVTLELKPSRKERVKTWAKEWLPILGIYAAGTVGLLVIYGKYTQADLQNQRDAAEARNDILAENLDRYWELHSGAAPVEEVSDNTVEF